MNRLTVAATMLAAALSVTLGAQKITPLKTGEGGSPHVRTDWKIDGASISIEYGRPLLKGRTPGSRPDHAGGCGRPRLWGAKRRPPARPAASAPTPVD